jgi:hypothetical protein
MKGRFGDDRIRFVEGDAFQHTDTLNLGEVKPEKFEKYDPLVIRRSYMLTLLNHLTLSRSSHMVMAQSGFGDTAFWKSRSSASCIFVDMTNNRYAWQHHLAYSAQNGSSAVAMKSRVIDITKPPTRFYD